MLKRIPIRSIVLIFILTLSINAAFLKHYTEGAASFNGGSQKIAELVNAEREKNGLKPVKFYVYSPIQKAARIRAGEIKSNFSHKRPNGSDWFTVLDSVKLDYNTAGENLGKGTDMSPESVMESWMNSAEHRENILNPKFNLMGVGCVWSERLNSFQWVQLFVCSEKAQYDFIDLLPEYASDIGQIMSFSGMTSGEYINDWASDLHVLRNKILNGQASVDDYLEMGRGSTDLGDTFGGRYYFQKALALCPNSVQACMGIATTFDENYDIEKKIEWLIKAKNMGGHDGALYAQIAECYYRIGQYDKAVSYIKIAEELSPQDDKVVWIRNQLKRFL